MLFATLLSTVFLLAGPTAITPSMEIVKQHELVTIEGRNTFLTSKLAPYAQSAAQLNDEITALSKTITSLSPEKDEQKIVSLSEEVAQKMARLTTMMTVLNLASSLNEDFVQIDTILHQADPLTPAQIEIVDRVALLCNSVDMPTEG